MQKGQKETKKVITKMGRRRKVCLWFEVFHHYLHCHHGRKPKGKQDSRANSISILTKQFNNYVAELGWEHLKITYHKMTRLLKSMGYEIRRITVNGSPRTVVMCAGYVVPYILTYEKNKGKRTGRKPKVCPPIVKALVNRTRASSNYSDTLNKIQDRLTKLLECSESKEDSGQLSKSPCAEV